MILLGESFREVKFTAYFVKGGFTVSENVYHWSKFAACSYEIFFHDLLLVNSSSRYFSFSHHIKGILYVNTYSKRNKWWNKIKRYKFSPVSDADTEQSCFLKETESKISDGILLTFHSFMSAFFKKTL